MSAMHSIEILLDAEYNINNLITLLERGTKMELSYRDAHSEIHGENYNFLESKLAAKRLINSTPEINNLGGPRLHIKYLDTQFDLAIYKSEKNLLELYISGFSWKWMKEFSTDEHHFDYARYSRLILDMCDDFTVLKFDIETLY